MNSNILLYSIHETYKIMSSFVPRQPCTSRWVPITLIALVALAALRSFCTGKKMLNHDHGSFKATSSAFSPIYALFQNVIAPSSPVSKQEDLVSASECTPYNFANRDWSQVESVLQASAGQRGAWFYRHPLKGSIVVKNQKEADKQILGTAVLRSLGMNAPECRLVAAESKEGKQLAAIGHSKGIDACRPTHFIVMDRVDGRSYQDLLCCTDDIALVTRNLKEIGKLVIYDLILGNFDRFQLDTAGFNGGNIMFEEGALRPIDTDCWPSENEEKKPFIRSALKKIAQGRDNYHERIARKLEDFLGSGERKEIFSPEEILSGMQSAIRDLKELSLSIENKKQKFIDECKQRGVVLDTFPPSVAEMITYIGKL